MRCVGIITLLLGCGPLPEPEPGTDAGARVVLSEPVTVEQVIDGDTLQVRRQGQIFRVRLKGINTPEMNFDSAQAPEPFAKAVDYAVNAGLRVGWSGTRCAPTRSARAQGVDGQACYDRYCRMSVTSGSSMAAISVSSSRRAWQVLVLTMSSSMAR